MATLILASMASLDGDIEDESGKFEGAVPGGASGRYDRFHATTFDYTSFLGPVGPEDQVGPAGILAIFGWNCRSPGTGPAEFRNNLWTARFL